MTHSIGIPQCAGRRGRLGIPAAPYKDTRGLTTTPNPSGEPEEGRTVLTPPWTANEASRNHKAWVDRDGRHDDMLDAEDLGVDALCLVNSAYLTLI
jgi:hypothetical protein